MESIKFDEKPIRETPPLDESLETEELVTKIENYEKLEEFKNGVEMAEGYIKIDAMEFLGDMTEEAMKKIAGSEEIRVEPIPKQLQSEDGPECKVYKITKNLSDLPDAKMIEEKEIERDEALKKDIAEQYEFLAKEGRLETLGILSHEEITKYKKDHGVSDEHIKSAACLDENGDLVKNSSFYYKMI